MFQIKDGGPPEGLAFFAIAGIGLAREEASIMAQGRRNVPGMIGVAAGMGYIVGLYGVLAVALLAPDSGITQSLPAALALPLVASLIGAAVGVTLTRGQESRTVSQGDWGPARHA